MIDKTISCPEAAAYIWNEALTSLSAGHADSAATLLSLMEDFRTKDEISPDDREGK